jgi:hypothetical protein
MTITFTAPARMAHYLDILRLSGLYGSTLDEVAERLVAERLHQLVMKRHVLLADRPPLPQEGVGHAG